MANNINQGSVLHICVTPQASILSQAAYEALTYVPIGSMVENPEVGEEANNPSQNYVTSTHTVFQRGIITGKAADIEVGRDDGDAGQDALFAASLTKGKYAFKMVYTDSPNPATTTNTTAYFRALVNPRTSVGGGSDDFTNDIYPIQPTDQSVIWVKPEPI